MPDMLLTEAETSERLRTPLATLRYWRQTGYGPRSAKIGRRVLYRESDVKAWLDERFTAANSAVG